MFLANAAIGLVALVEHESILAIFPTPRLLRTDTPREFLGLVTLPQSGRLSDESIYHHHVSQSVRGNQRKT